MAFGFLYICFLARDLVKSPAAPTISAKTETYAFLRWVTSGSGQMADSTYLKPTQFCSQEHDRYCINGNCMFHKELRIPTCRCLAGYSGERCEHWMLNTYAQHSYEHYIAFGIGAGMLLIGMFAIIYCYIRKRNKKTSNSYEVCHEETAL